MGKSTKIILISLSVVIVGGGLFAWYWFGKHTSDVHLNYIPKDAAAVFSIHSREIAAKIDPSKLKPATATTYKTNDIPDFLLNIMADPLNTGIDPVQNIYGFVTKQDQATVSALVLAVDGESSFTSFVQRMFPDRKPEEAPNGNYLDIDEARAIIWNSEAAVFISANGADVRAYSEKLFTQGEAGSIKQNEKFTAFNAKTFDAGLFTENKKLSALNMETSALSLMGMGEGTSEFFMRFEQNEIVTEFTSSKQSQPSLVKQNGLAPADLNYLGMKDPLLFIGTTFDVKSLLASASNDPMMSQNVEGITAGLGLTQDEMAQLFTGTVTAAITDYRNIFETDPRVQKETKEMMGPLDNLGSFSDMMDQMLSIEVPITAISFGITDEKKANEMLALIGMKKMEGDFWAAPGIELVIYTVVKSNHLIVTNDFLTAEAIAKEGKLPGKLPAEYVKNVPAQPFSFWMDLDKQHMPELLLNPKSPLLDPDDLASYVNLSEVFQSVRFESTPEKSSFHFVMPQSETNSLMRMLNYASAAK